MRYYLVWLTRELTEEHQKLLGLYNPSVLNAHWNGFDSMVMIEPKLNQLREIGVVHLFHEISYDAYQAHKRLKRSVRRMNVQAHSR